MPSDEYAPTVRGGLKLKGSNPAGIKKKKSKSKPKESEPSKEKTSALQEALADEDASISKEVAKKGKKQADEEEVDVEKLRELEERGGDGKTDSERAYEEMRRKRLQDRIAREGPKTHKQRVEELNKYLSNLSEHHDMPRIGPG